MVMPFATYMEYIYNFRKFCYGSFDELPSNERKGTSEERIHDIVFRLK